MSRGVPCRTFRDWNTTRRVASMGQREVHIQADGRAAWRAETTQFVCDFFGRRRFDVHIDNRREGGGGGGGLK